MNDNIPAKTSYTEEVLKKFNKSKTISDKSEEKSVYVNEISKKWNMNDKIVDLFERNIEKDQKLRSIYAIILITMLFVELLALTVIFILVGCGKLEYSETTFNLFITGGIAEIYVLVKVIVKYLFKDNLTNALNIILENNNKTNYYKHKKKNIQETKSKEN